MEKNGTSFLQGSTIGIELVDEFRKQIQLLVEYTVEVCKSAYTTFSRVYRQLTEMGNVFSQFDKRITTLENISNNKQYKIEASWCYRIDTYPLEIK